MKTKNNTLEFSKNAIIELNNIQLNKINGGSDSITSTAWCLGEYLAEVLAPVIIDILED